MGRAMFTVIAAMAELERSVIRERVAAGLEYARHHGTRSGKAVGRPRVFRRDEVAALGTGPIAATDRPQDGRGRRDRASGTPCRQPSGQGVPKPRSGVSDGGGTVSPRSPRPAIGYHHNAGCRTVEGYSLCDLRAVDDATRH